jgi:hypothetical protein
VTILGYVLLPVLGLVAGVMLAFVCIPGNTDIWISLGIAAVLGLIGIAVGFFGGTWVLAWTLDAERDRSVAGVNLREVGR